MFDFNDEVTYSVAVVLVIAGFFLVLYYGLNGYLDSVGRKWRREHNLPDWNDDWHNDRYDDYKTRKDADRFI